MKNKKKTKTIIIAVIAVLIFASAMVFMLLSQKVKMNKGYVTGNTAGNLNNGGLFCESEGIVYFSNLYDDGCLYSMNADGTDMKKLSTSKVTSINADSNYVYYYMDSAKKGESYVQRNYGIFRSKRNGKDSHCLKRGNAITIQLCGNYLFYQSFSNYNQNGTELYKIKIDKSEDILVADYLVNPACIVDGVMYFSGTQDDHYLYTLNTYNHSVAVQWTGADVWNPIYYGGYYYYMDVANNYRLCRYFPVENSIEVLTEDRVDCFNVYGDYIYYQKNSQSEPALKRMYIDGSGNEVVASGNYTNINMTADYVYFTVFGSNTPMYRTPTMGPVNVTVFDAAETAAIAEQAKEAKKK